jgi:flagellar biosynthesis protein
MARRSKLKEAVALKYSPPKDPAPKVTAKGRGVIAEKIIELAKRYDIPIQEDPDLVQILAQLELDQEIPPELYQVVAEILAFVYSLNSQWQERNIRGG